MTSERTKVMDDLIAQDADLIDSPLVERLRERTCVVFNSPGVHPDTECLEAADRIEALEAENAKLREKLEQTINQLCGDCHTTITRAALKG